MLREFQRKELSISTQPVITATKRITFYVLTEFGERNHAAFPNSTPTSTESSSAYNQRRARAKSMKAIHSQFKKRLTTQTQKSLVKKKRKKKLNMLSRSS